MRGRRVACRWQHLAVAVVEDDRPVTRGIMAPRVAACVRGRDEAAAAGALGEVTPDTVCVLEIAVHPEHHGASPGQPRPPA